MTIISCHKEIWDIPKNINFFISSSDSSKSEQQWRFESFSDPSLNQSSDIRLNVMNLKTQLSIENMALMNQSHSNTVLELVDYKNYLRSDAIFTRNTKIACAVITADCLPILVTNKSGTFIGCIHAGWRGLIGGIIEKFFKKVKNIDKSEFKVLIGPSISKKRYEVDQFIFDLFSEYSSHFTYNNNGKYNMDLRNIANEILSRQGINDVTISSECTFDNRCFFSYRRDKTIGRFISLIWFNNS
jgi:YfiH family protein